MSRREPGVANGSEEFLRDLSAPMRGWTIDEIKVLAGQADLVFIVAQGTDRGAPCAYVDPYRTKDGKIVEHGGFPWALPAEADTAFGSRPSLSRSVNPSPLRR